MRRHPTQVRVVVARHERLHPLEGLRDGHPLDGDEARAHERAVDGVDDVHAVRELVQPQRVQVQLACMRRIAREETGVPVAWAEQG